MNKALMNLLPYKLVNNHLQNSRFFNDESTETPELYTADGELVKVFYLKNSLNTHYPYSMVSGRISNRILWDRFNEGLPIHFYNHQDMLSTSKYGVKKFGILRESEAIVPADYRYILEHPSVAQEFDQIFTHNEEILNRYSNASFVPAYGLWYGSKRYGGELSPDNYTLKTKEVSIIASNKDISEYHKIRRLLAEKYMSHPKVDGYGKACGNYVDLKADALTPYRYSIVVENGNSSYYFTEKILDCFASMTVPIYLGAPKIGEFFNMDGIIVIDKNNPLELDQILATCSESDYLARLDAIKDNFNRVHKYISFEDYILDNYGEMFEV